MAKDPAFLFYPGDYLRDTQCLSEKTQVSYDRIMCEHMRNICISKQQLKFFTKRLSEDETEELMMILTEINGGYQISWVAESIVKRQAYSESRRKNRENKSDSHKKDMKTYVSHMENEDEKENIIIDGVKKEIADFFGFNEISHFQNIKQINSFVNLLQDRTHFEQQFKNYREFISIRGKQYQLGFKKYIGTPSEQFKDGQWNSENWSEKLDAEKNKKIKKSKTLQHDSDFATN